MILPINITFKEWASQIRIDLPNIDIPIPPGDVETWRNWASQVVYTNRLANVPLPTALAYPNLEDWRIWAAYFINSIIFIGADDDV